MQQASWERVDMKSTLHISTLLSASSISSLSESTLAAMAGLVDLVACNHLQNKGLFN